MEKADPKTANRILKEQEEEEAKMLAEAQKEWNERRK
jgi:hypothetical protein